VNILCALGGETPAPVRRWTIAVGLLLVLNVAGFFPLLMTKGDPYLPPVSLGPFRWVGIVPICLGAILAVWSAVLLSTRGRGTPAPWDPPQRFVLAGPYRYVRNPMMLGLFGILVGEALLAQSLAILLYLGLVASVVWGYVVVVEEKALERRFGDAYRVYKARVPRWVPRWNRGGRRG
jgi:protein-S-isoprenylcysteine O-methyltransferase Ste14